MLRKIGIESIEYSFRYHLGRIEVSYWFDTNVPEMGRTVTVAVPLDRAKLADLTRSAERLFSQELGGTIDGAIEELIYAVLFRAGVDFFGSPTLMKKALTDLHRGRLTEGLGIRRGAPRGMKKSKAAIRFSKRNLRNLLAEKTCELSRKDIEPTRRAVARVLDLPNAKALDRLRRQFKIAPDWRQYVAKVTAGK
jgi:hypothetical protein